MIPPHAHRGTPIVVLFAFLAVHRDPSARMLGSRIKARSRRAAQSSFLHRWAMRGLLAIAFPDPLKTNREASSARARSAPKPVAIRRDRRGSARRRPTDASGFPYSRCSEVPDEGALTATHHPFGCSSTRPARYGNGVPSGSPLCEACDEMPDGRPPEGTRFAHISSRLDRSS